LRKTREMFARAGGPLVVSSVDVDRPTDFRQPARKANQLVYLLKIGTNIHFLLPGSRYRRSHDGYIDD